jgi:hypothetical protein
MTTPSNPSIYPVTTFIADLNPLSVELLQALIAEARKEIHIRNARAQSVRQEMERAARAAGLTPEEAAILFGRK